MSRQQPRQIAAARGDSRDSSASSREALEMSVISRSSRPTSCFRMRSSRVARGAVLDQVQGLHRRADRGQRVADLVGDVGGEALDGLHAVGQGVGHVLQRAGQVAELVVALGEVGQGDGPRALQPHPVGRRGQAQHRLGDQLGQQQRGEQGHRDGDQDERASAPRARRR